MLDMPTLFTHGRNQLLYTKPTGGLWCRHHSMSQGSRALGLHAGGLGLLEELCAAAAQQVAAVSALTPLQTSHPC